VDDHWTRVKAAFGEALALEPGERLAYVAEVCGPDSALRAEVERLLQSHERAGAFLEGDAAIEIAAADQMVGRAIGAYVVREPIGAGGMGVVYRADRADGVVQQRVAIKLVHGHLRFPLLLERFHQERRILALLEHPSIARLLDAGALPDGLPYVMMEYVDGVPIDQYCVMHGLRLRDRLALFRQVCDAVHYAHQRLVIHRDIKSGNILVTAEGLPRLLDFGIAKLIDPAVSTDVPQPTVLRALSFESASPEQVCGNAITVTSDVYALGVLLYRLIANRGPYGDPAGEQEWRLAICEREPTAPSVVARQSGDPGERIDRDLDLIVLKALRKEPDRRYGSVQQLADDVVRYVQGLPVLAAPDGAAYRARKFVGRHATSVGAAIVVALALVASTAVALWQAHVATTQRTLAERRFADVRRLANSFLFEFHDSIANVPGTLSARQLVTTRAAEYLDRLSQEAQGDPTLQRELATAYVRLGMILGGGGVANLGDIKGAETQYQRALAIFRALVARREVDVSDINGLANLLVQFARLAVLTGELARGEEYAHEAVRLWERLPPGDAAHARLSRLAISLHQLGFVQARRAEDSAALQSLEQAMAYARQDVDGFPGDPAGAALLSRISIDYAGQLMVAHRPGDALRVTRDGRDSIERLLEQDPLNATYRAALIGLLIDEGDAFAALGDTSSSVGAYTRAVAEAEMLRDASPNDRSTQIQVMMARYNLAMALIESGQVDQGERTLRRAISEGEAITAASPGDGFTVNQVAAAEVELGETLITRTSRRDEGCRTLRDGLRLWNDLAARQAAPAESQRHRERFDNLWKTCETSSKAR
jgi:non-specific serine/threonine protein kinase/serine/threonine-protein kinase